MRNKVAAIAAHIRIMSSFFSVPILSIIGYMKDAVSKDNEIPKVKPKMMVFIETVLKTTTVRMDVIADIKMPHRISNKNEMYLAVIMSFLFTGNVISKLLHFEVVSVFNAVPIFTINIQDCTANITEMILFSLMIIGKNIKTNATKKESCRLVLIE